MLNYMIVDKKQIADYFKPFEIDVLNIHHLYIELDNDLKTAKYEVNFIKTDYMSFEYIKYLYSTVNILDKEATKRIQDLISELEDTNRSLREYLIIPEMKDDYQSVIDYLKRNNLLTKMPKWDGSYYIGERYDDYYHVIGHHRDSKLIDESNYYSIKECLEKNSIDFIEVSANHWAVGWIEQILIHEDDIKGIEFIEDEILDRLKDYPIIDEDDLFERERSRRDELREMIKKDLKAQFDSYQEKKDYIKRAWSLELGKDKIEDIIDILAGEDY